MRQHFEALLVKFQLPKDGDEALREAAGIIFSKHNMEFTCLVAKFYRLGFRLKLMEKDLQELSRVSNINYYTLCGVFVAAASKNILQDYLRAGLSEELFWDTIMDLKYKLFECKTVKGVWGTFVLFWYPIFFSLNIYKLGRLEFERSSYYMDTPCTVGDMEIKKGDPVFSVHIPSCGSLSKELRMDSYKRAYEFFADELNGKPLVCVCHSWLLFGDNRKIFPQHLNMVDFMNDWKIVESNETEDFEDAWRVFGMDYDPEKVPIETTQQKAVYEWIQSGGKTGEGFGVLVFDGKEIINK